MKHSLEYDVLENGALRVGFDNPTGGSYRIDLLPDQAESGDGVVLYLDPAACLSFAKLFAQLAKQGGHVHVGYDETEPQGPGMRITVTDTPHDG